MVLELVSEILTELWNRDGGHGQQDYVAKKGSGIRVAGAGPRRRALHDLHEFLGITGCEKDLIACFGPMESHGGTHTAGTNDSNPQRAAFPLGQARLSEQR
jgi:hypothetical protein